MGDAVSALEDTLAFYLQAVGLPRPEREYRFAAPRRFRFDFAWPVHSVAAEVDGATWSGGRHSRGSGIERDAEKYSLAAARGWRVLRVTRHMIESGAAVQLIEEALAWKETG